MQRQFKEKVEDFYKEYSEVNKIVQEKNKIISDKQGDLKKTLEGKSIEELQNVLTHTYVDTLLYNKELQFLFVKAVNAIEIYKSIVEEPLSETVEEFYKTMKQWMPKRMFAVEKEELVEVEVGLLDQERKNFLEGEFFQKIISQVQQPTK